VVSDARTLTRTEANGASTVEQFDEWGNLVQRTRADGSIEILEREPRFSQVRRYVDPNGNITLWSHDSRGRLTALTEAADKPEARTTQYRYDEFGNLKDVTRLADRNTLESMWQYAYDQMGNVVRITDPVGRQLEFAYNPQGNVTRFTDARGNGWNLEYDAAGRLVSEQDPHGFNVQYVYDAAGNLVSVRDKRGNTTRFEYDARDRLVRSTDALGYHTSSSYDADGYLVEAIDELGHARYIVYDTLKRLTTLTDGAANELRFAYPASGATASPDPIRIVAPTIQAQLQYDARRRIVESVSQAGNDAQTLRITYDNNNNRIAVRGADGRETRYEYDGLDRVVRATDALGNAIFFDYDNRDNIIAVTDPRGHAWRFEYDKLNRLVSETRPLGQVLRYRYEKGRRPTEVINAKGQRTEYAYDALERVVTRNDFEGPTVSPSRVTNYRYDPNGNLETWSDGSYSASRDYDRRNRLVAETLDYGSFSLSYRYDYYANGLTRSITYPGGTSAVYRYTAAEQLEAIEIPGEGTISFTQFSWLAPTRVLLPGGTRLTADHDGRLRLTALEATAPSGALLFQLHQEWGKAGELLSRTLNGQTAEFRYDEEIRLIEEASNGTRNSYQLDSTGNRIAESGRIGDWEYDANNRLLRQGATRYEYDDDGNVTAIVSAAGTIRMFYDVAGRLIRTEDMSGRTLGRYEYDPLGRRISKRTGDSVTYFLHAHEGLLGEYDSLGAERVAYGWRPGSGPSTAPVFIKRGDRYFYYQNDHLGTPHGAIDRSGSPVWSARYTAFGDATVSPDSVLESNLRLPGQYFDSETGLHYNTLRYYDPRLGRYLQVDPIGLAAGPNLYLYARGDPLRFRDPWGLEIEAADITLQAAPCFRPALFGTQVHSLFSDHARQQGYLANTTFDALGNRLFGRYRPDAWSDGRDGRPVEVWELKPDSHRGLPQYQYAVDQLNVYICTIPPVGQPAFPGDPRALVPPDGRLGYVRHCGVDYEIKLHSDNGPTGLIFYSYDRVETKTLLDEIVDMLKQLGRRLGPAPGPYRPPPRRDDVLLSR
jgi:RHS repeat-associated protein